MLVVQKQFGLDGGGGYSRQMERSMEMAVAWGLLAPAEFHCKRAEMMESLASGLDDGRTRTQGMCQVLPGFGLYSVFCPNLRGWRATEDAWTTQILSFCLYFLLSSYL